LAHRCADQVVTSFVQLAEFSHFSHTHIGVAGDVCPGEAFALALAGGLHPGADDRRWFAHSVAGQLVIIHTRDFNMDVDPVEQGAGDAFLVFGNGG